MEAAAQEEVSEKKTQSPRSVFLLQGYMCVSWLGESPAASVERASGQTPCTLFIPLHVNETIEESSCCHHPPSSANKRLVAMPWLQEG